VSIPADADTPVPKNPCTDDAVGGCDHLHRAKTERNESGRRAVKLHAANIGRCDGEDHPPGREALRNEALADARDVGKFR
jgi:hypothetical protein